MSTEEHINNLIKAFEQGEHINYYGQDAIVYGYEIQNEIFGRMYKFNLWLFPENGAGHPIGAQIEIFTAFKSVG